MTGVMISGISYRAMLIFRLLQRKALARKSAFGKGSQNLPTGKGGAFSSATREAYL